MRRHAMIGFLLILLGLAGLAYQGIAWTISDPAAAPGPLLSAGETARSLPVPPVAGALSLALGITVLAAGGKNSAKAPHSETRRWLR